MRKEFNVVAEACLQYTRRATQQIPTNMFTSSLRVTNTLNSFCELNTLYYYKTQPTLYLLLTDETQPTVYICRNKRENSAIYPHHSQFYIM